MQQATTNLSAARMIIYKRTPYLKVAMLVLAYKPAPGLGTCGMTEHGILLYDPAVVASWQPKQVSGVLVHEWLHLFMKHHERAKGRNRDAWNTAADIAVNQMVLAMGFELPGKPLLPSMFGFPPNLAAEEYYELLQGRQSKQQSGQQGQQGASGAPGRPQDSAPGRPQDSAQGASRGQQQGRPAWPGEGGPCGSAAGNAVPGEPDANAPEARSPARLARAAAQVAEQIRDASNSRGNVPAGLARFAEAMLKPPQVNWRLQLRHVIRSVVRYRPGGTRLDWRMPSKRQAGLGYGIGHPILPRYVTTIPKVAVVLDTSGSMGSKRLGAGVTEALGVLKALGSTISFMTIDAQVHGFKSVANAKEMLGLLRGGGGTYLSPALQALEKLPKRSRPDVAIIITDGYCESHVYLPRGIQIIWLIIDGRVPAPWGKPIVISSKQQAAE